VKENPLEIPFAVGEVDQVDAGWLGETDGGELDTAAPQRADAERGMYCIGADDGLGAEGGIFVNDKVFQGKAWKRKEIQGDLVEVNRTAETVANAVGDSFLIAVHANERGEKDEEKDYEASYCEIKEPTESMSADRRRDVCFRGFGLRVGWIHFLHGVFEFSRFSSQLSEVSYCF
jgi:hypothetical protein